MTMDMLLSHTVLALESLAVAEPVIGEQFWTSGGGLAIRGDQFAMSGGEFAMMGEQFVESATGWPGMAIVFAYSFLIAFVLPGPSEIVLAAPLDLGLPYWLDLAAIMLVSATGKAAGSVLAFHIGQEAKGAGPVVRWLRRSRWDVLAWTERRSVQVAQQYGYAGLAIALSIPFFPDTISIYAFAVLEEDYAKFAVATFLGSLGRLVVTVVIIGGAITVF